MPAPTQPRQQDAAPGEAPKRYEVVDHKNERYAVVDTLANDEVITQGVDPDAMDAYCERLNAGLENERPRGRRRRRGQANRIRTTT